MKHKFILLSVPALIAPAAALATVYLSLEQAQALMFPQASLTPDFRTLTEDQAKQIKRDSGVNVLNRELKTWRVAGGGWFIVDRVLGKHEFITYAVALDAHGGVKQIEILEYRESYGDQIRNPQWRAQFYGKQHGATLKLDEDIKNISGATLSCRHITDGIKRLLSTYALVLAPAG